MQHKCFTFISPQSLEPVNREIFFELERHGYKCRVLIPVRDDVVISDSMLSIEGQRIENYHPRKSFLTLTPTLYDWLKESNAVFYESDVSSFGVLQLIIWKYRYSFNFQIFVSTFENRELDYLSLSVALLAKKKLKGAGYFLLWLLEKFNTRFISSIITYSKQSKDILTKKYPNSEVVQHTLGINADLFYYPREETPLNRIGCLGRMVPGKNPHIVYQVFKELLNRGYRLQLVTQMPGANCHYSEYLYSLLANLDSNNLKIVDPSHAEMADVLKTIDLLLMPSEESEDHKEQYGRLIVEAKLSGCIVLASKSGAFPEVLASSDLLLERLDINYCVDKCIKLLDLSNQQRLNIVRSLSDYALKHQTTCQQAIQILALVNSRSQ